MSNTARATTNAEGRTISGYIDFSNLKTEQLWDNQSKSIFKSKRSKSLRGKLGYLFNDDRFSLLAKHVEMSGVKHDEIISFGVTENKTIKFIDVMDGWQFREQSGRIFSRKVDLNG